MKILICAYACLKDPDERIASGGESELGWNLALQAARKNQVWVLTDAGNKMAIENKTKEENLPSLHFCYIALPFWLQFLKKYFGGVQWYAYLWQIKAYVVSKKLHAKIHFDLFHHTTYANDWMASFIGALLPVPYVRGPGGGAHRVPSIFFKEYSFKEKLIELMRSAGQWIFRHDPFFVMGQHKSKVLLVCNQEAFDALPQAWQSKTSFFPVNGISKNDMEIFSQSLPLPSGSFIIFTAGKLIKIKAFDLAIQAFAKVHKQMPTAKLVIAGDGPQLKRLKTLAGELGVLEKVIFLGWIPREKLLQQMHACDVFLFTSLRDGGGAVVIEAMAAKKPVVCFDISGPGFHIQDNWGLKIKPISKEQSVQDISVALKKVHDDKEWGKKMGENAHQRVLDFYLWDVLGDKLNNIYQATASHEK